MIKLTNVERETIYTFNEAELTAICFTYNRKLQNQLRQLAEDRPDDCRFLKENIDGGVTYQIPKKWIKIKPSRIISDEQRAAMSERMKSIRANQSGENRAE